ncbi:MAG: transcriptional regulator MraZ [Candidatus Dojkabacteria bacterium]|nr:MAG: transcriptional regulator MraZ [Candidatus Dojkabacteria bacterium]
MLIGEFETKITDNNRVAVPKKFRGELGDDLIILNGYEGCLIIVDEQKFLALTKDIVEGRFINDAVRDMTRFLVGSAQEIHLDNQGRFVLPQSLRDYACLESECIFLGLFNWIELWSKSRWMERKKFVKRNAAEIASKLARTLDGRDF